MSAGETMSEDPEFLKLSSMLGRLRARISPEVKAAFATIVSALLDEDPLTSRKAERERHESAQKKRIERAERAVKTRRKNAKEERVEVKARCMVYSPDGLLRCELDAVHRRDHQKGKFFWKRVAGEDRFGRTRRPHPGSPRVSKKPARPQPKKKSPPAPRKYRPVIATPQNTGRRK